MPYGGAQRGYIHIAYLAIYNPITLLIGAILRTGTGTTMGTDPVVTLGGIY